MTVIVDNYCESSINNFLKFRDFIQFLFYNLLLLTLIVKAIFGSIVLSESFCYFRSAYFCNNYVSKLECGADFFSLNLFSKLLILNCFPLFISVIFFSNFLLNFQNNYQGNRVYYVISFRVFFISKQLFLYK